MNNNDNNNNDSKNKNNNNCGTVSDVPFMPSNPRLAHAYVPFQIDYETFEVEEALDKGTIFPSLYSPYEGKFPEGGICK